MDFQQALLAAVGSLSLAVAFLYRELNSRLKACETDREKLWLAVNSFRVRPTRRRPSSRVRKQRKS